MAIHTPFFISGSRIENIPMRQHGSPFIWNVQNVPMALLTLLILEGCIRRLPILPPIIRFPREVNHHILDAVGRLGKKEIEGIMGSGKMTVHAVSHKALGIVDMGGHLPRLIGRFNLVAGGAESGCRGPDHGVVRDAEQGEGDDDSDADEKDR